MNILVGVIGRSPSWTLPGPFVDRLRTENPDHRFSAAADYEGIRRLLPDADVAFTGLVDRDLFPSLTRLRWIQVPSVAVSHLMFPEMVESGVAVTNARGIRARAIAEHVLGVAIALSRGFATASRAQAGHRWAQDAIEGTPGIRTLRGCHAGVIGLGSVGSEVARTLSAFGLRVSAVRRRAGAPPVSGVGTVVPPTELEHVLRTSDVVVLAVPLTRSTRRLIGRDQLAAMKPDALLINVGRGELVDDEALVAALKNGRLGGCALDVFTHEPLDPASPYWDLPNVIVTPHVSGALADYWSPLVDLFSDNLRRFERGEPLVNAVDKHFGY